MSEPCGCYANLETEEVVHCSRHSEAHVKELEGALKLALEWGVWASKAMSYIVEPRDLKLDRAALKGGT